MAGYFSKTNFTPSTSNTYTVSFWVKINNFSPTNSDVPYLWSISSSNTSGLFFQADTLPRNICFFRSNGSTRSVPTNNMRDVNAWYHIHLKVSSGTGTLYYNGESVKTSITVDAQNYGGGGAEHYVHTYGGGLSSYDNLDCVMSHFHFVDGTAYDPTVFGSTDATTGEWKINTSPSVTYGTNGYFILKDGNTGTDHSGNGNNFTLTGTCTKTEDNPSNIFATMNPIDSYWMSATYSNGNNKVVTQSSHRTSMAATLGASSGKYYYEVKFDAETNNAGIVVGIDTKGASSCSIFNGNYCDEYTGRRTYGWGYYANDGVVYNGGNNVGSYTSFSTGTIICVAVDLDNNKLYYRRNDNAWENSGDPTSGSTGTGAISITAASSTDTGFYFPALSDGSNSGTATFSTNFGNGYFGTTAVSSAGTNASNIGIFEYDVPTGYTAWSTKGLNL